MAFIRTKKIGGKDYAYLVENSWQKGSRQRVKGYIGRVYNFNITNNVDFLPFKNLDGVEEYIQKNEIATILRDLIDWEFLKHNIGKNEFGVDLNNITVEGKVKCVCIKINGGYLCSHTLSNLLNFKKEADETEDSMGFRLARAFVDSGINIPQDVFIRYFEKIRGKGEKQSLGEFYY